MNAVAEMVAEARQMQRHVIGSKGSKTRPVSPLGGASKPMTIVTTDEGVVSKHHGHLSAAQLASCAMQKRDGIVAVYVWTAANNSGEVVASMIGRHAVARHPAH